MFLGRTKYFHDASQLLLLVLSWEDGVAREQFCKDTTQTPHVDGQTIAHAQNDLGRSVESRLDVRVDLFRFEAAGSEINDLDLRVQGVRQQNVLGLQVTVDDLLLLQKNQRGQDLLAETTDQTQREALELVCFDELVQVHAKQLRGDAKMASEVEALCKVDHTVLVVGILNTFVSNLLHPLSLMPTYPFAKLLENVDLNQSLLVEPLLVTNDLDGL